MNMRSSFVAAAAAAAWTAFWAVALIAVGATGATVTWTGSGNDGFWDTAANWSPATVPGAGDDAVIPSLGGISSFVVVRSAASVGTLVVGSATEAAGTLASLDLQAPLTASSMSFQSGSGMLNVAAALACMSLTQSSGSVYFQNGSRLSGSAVFGAAVSGVTFSGAVTVSGMSSAEFQTPAVTMLNGASIGTANSTDSVSLQLAAITVPRGPVSLVAATGTMSVHVGNLSYANLAGAPVALTLSGNGLQAQLDFAQVSNTLSVCGGAKVTFGRLALQPGIVVSVTSESVASLTVVSDAGIVECVGGSGCSVMVAGNIESLIVEDAANGAVNVDVAAGVSIGRVTVSNSSLQVASLVANVLQLIDADLYGGVSVITTLSFGSHSLSTSGASAFTLHDAKVLLLGSATFAVASSPVQYTLTVDATSSFVLEVGANFTAPPGLVMRGGLFICHDKSLFLFGVQYTQYWMPPPTLVYEAVFVFSDTAQLYASTTVTFYNSLINGSATNVTVTSENPLTFVQSQLNVSSVSLSWPWSAYGVSLTLTFQDSEAWLQAISCNVWPTWRKAAVVVQFADTAVYYNNTVGAISVLPSASVNTSIGCGAAH